MIHLAHMNTSLAQVLDLAEEIGYGEIYDVELESPHTPSVQRKVTTEQQKFVEIVYGMGITSIAKLVIHNGCPSVLEIRGERYGLPYRQKLKIY